MHGHVLVLLFTAVACDAIKIEVSKPTATQLNITKEANETITEATTLTTPTTTTAVPSTVAPKPETTKSTTASTSTSTEATTTTLATTSTTTSTTPAPGADDSKALRGTANKGNVQLRCTDQDCYKTFCACNLKHGLCDIDCCCDVDCSDEELKTVNCVGEQERLDNFYYHMTLSPCSIDNGYLCVFRSNFDKSRHKDIKFDLDSPPVNEWPPLLLERSEIPEQQNFYKINDPVLLYNLEFNEIVEFDMPYSLTGQHCQFEESLRHLKPKKTSCNFSLDRAQAMESKLYQKLSTSLLLQRPNARVPINGIIKETQLEFLSINLFRCTSEDECTPSSIFNSTFDAPDDEFSSHVQVKIYHNITNILACDVLFIRGDRRSDSVWQHFEVTYIQGNETDYEKTQNVSGPLGYTQGGPLIVGHKVLLNESGEFIESNTVLSYFHPNKTEPIHIHPPRRRLNSCERSQDTLNFGESILVQCSVQLDNSTELHSDTNFTKICLKLHDQALGVLTASSLQEEYFVSMLGYPTDQMNRWTKLDVKNYEPLPVVGVFLDKEYAFICQNMILGVKYEFLMLVDAVEGNANQAVVRRASIDVGKRHDLQFQLDESISVPLTFSVIFRDPRETSGSSAKWSALRGTILIFVYVFGFILVV